MGINCVGVCLTQRFFPLANMKGKDGEQKQVERLTAKYANYRRLSLIPFTCAFSTSPMDTHAKLLLCW